MRSFDGRDTLLNAVHLWRAGRRAGSETPAARDTVEPWALGAAQRSCIFVASWVHAALEEIRKARRFVDDALAENNNVVRF